MKKFFLGSVAILVFSLSIIVFQMSCTKTAIAGDDDDDDCNGGNSISNILFVINPYHPETPLPEELWIMDSNGNGKRKINVQLPSGERIEKAKFVDKGTKILIQIVLTTEPYSTIWKFYKCNLNGSGLVKIYESRPFETHYLEDSY